MVSQVASSIHSVPLYTAHLASFSEVYKACTKTSFSVNESDLWYDVEMYILLTSAYHIVGNLQGKILWFSQIRAMPRTFYPQKFA